MLLKPYQESWPREFLALAQVITHALPNFAVVVEHVGSTAVPGLAAKPIIDIDLAYPPNVPFAAVAAGLQLIGYVHAGNQGIVGREVFKRSVTSSYHAVLDGIPHHLYVCPVLGDEFNRHVLFRDFLRANEPTRQRYQNLKTRLAEEAQQDRKQYAALKEVHARSFVNEVVVQARRQTTETK